SDEDILLYGERHPIGWNTCRLELAPQMSHLVAQERDAAPATRDERDVPRARSPFDHGRIETGDKHLGHRLLNRTDGDRRLRNLEVLARVGDAAFLEPHLDDVPRFHRDGRSLGKIAMETVELVLLIARSDADDGAAAGLHVEKADFLDQANRV